MNYVKTIVCFANSRKTSGRCVAGKEWHKGKPRGWIRPISTRPTHEVSEEERRYEDGGDPQLLDIIDIAYDLHQPLSHQHENHVIDPGCYWSRRGRLAWSEVSNWLDHPDSLWGVRQSSYSGLNNRVKVGQEDGRSLYLVEVDRLQILVGRKTLDYPDSKRAVRGEFVYRGVTYRLDVTDPFVEREYLCKADGQYVINKPVLCVSLGDPYEGYFYKLLAAVLYPERFK